MSQCGQQWIFRKEYGNRSSIHWYFLQCTLPDNWTKDCINIFLFKCPFNLIAFWTQLHIYDFYYYYSLTPHDRVLHLIMHCMEWILVCCQITEFDVSYFLHCKKCCKNHSLFTIFIPFMILWALLCCLSAISFSGLKRTSLFIFFHMIVILYLW